MELLDYGARRYDPQIGRFISPDTIIPDPGNPQSFNRYAYVNNNPQRYTDPSGYCIPGETCPEEIDETGGFLPEQEMRKLLDSAGVTLDRGDWTRTKLGTVYEVVSHLSIAMGGPEAFKTKLGGVTIDQQPIRNPGQTIGHNVTLRESGFAEWAAVHELAHVWNNNSGQKLSEGLETFTGGHTDPGAMREFLRAGLNDTALPGCNKAGYFYGDIPPKGSDINFNRSEDFSESVAAYVYPKLAACRSEKSRSKIAVFCAKKEGIKPRFRPKTNSIGAFFNDVASSPTGC